MAARGLFIPLAVAILACVSSQVGAQSTAAAGSVIVIPVIAATGSYASEVTVRNPNSGPIDVSVSFYEAQQSSSSGQQVTCKPLTVPALTSIPFSLRSQCPTLSGASHFGQLMLADAATQQIDSFFAYSRTQTPQGDGFSVEGFPVGAFSGAKAEVVGLKRQAAAPGFQTNCFVAALGESISYTMLLHDGTTGAPIGNQVSDTLQPYQMNRYLKVFDAVSANPGDYSNVRATFQVTSGPAVPAMVAFCTVQDNVSFGADFRIAKSTDAMNDSMRRIACIGMDNCGFGQPPSATQPEIITDATQRNVYSMIITQPDYVRCDVTAASGDLANLQLRLRVPGDAFASPQFTVTDTNLYSSGGAGKQTFYVYTGPRSTIPTANGGTATRWFVDVETVNTSVPVPIDFGLTCQSGNGTEVPWLRGMATRAAF